VYFWGLPRWPDFSWDEAALAATLADARYRQGMLLGRMSTLGFPLRAEATLATLTEDVVKTSAIEGERLERSQVRSSIARRLGMDAGGLVAADRSVEGIVEVMLDATRNFERRLTKERLFGWHAALFPAGRSGLRRIVSGGWRDDRTGPMQVVSGPVGREKVHFEAPPARRIDAEIARFLDWFESAPRYDPVLASAIAHLWFVTIHPFDDGNGRIARAVADMMLARSERSAQRFYSMSSQIRLERARYYRILERTQKGTLDVTPWLAWFLGCFSRALDNSQAMLESTLRKARFWQTHGTTGLNARQTKVLNRLLEGFEGKLTSGKWASLNKCSQDTAYRDILELVEHGILARNPAGGRSTSYSLRKIW
jgi:Fic family protein